MSWAVRLSVSLSREGGLTLSAQFGCHCSLHNEDARPAGRPIHPEAAKVYRSKKGRGRASPSPVSVMSPETQLFPLSPPYPLTDGTRRRRRRLSQAG